MRRTPTSPMTSPTNAFEGLFTLKASTTNLEPLPVHEPDHSSPMANYTRACAGIGFHADSERRDVF